MDSHLNQSLIRPGLSTPIRKHLPVIKANLRAKVPPVTYEELRRHRMPYHDALRRELCEGGFMNAANFFDRISEYEESGIERPPGVPPLTQMKNLLDVIFDHLKQAEIESKAENAEMQANILLNLALFLEKCDKSLLWIVSRVFVLTLEAAIKFKADGGRLEGLARYHYANFLFHKSQLIDEAASEVELAVEIVRGRDTEENWVIDIVEQKSLTKELLHLYFKIFMEKSRKISDLEKASKIASHAITIVSELNNPKVVAECYYEYGSFLQDKKYYTKAIDAFNNGIKFASKTNDKSTVCIGQYEISVCYKHLNNYKNAEHYVNLIRQSIEKHSLIEWIPEVLLLSAEIEMQRGNLTDAIKKSTNALEAFQTRQIPEKEKLQQARCLVGNCKAQKMFKSFVDTIFHANEESTSHIFNLLNWQIRRSFIEL